jgi:uncharacterized protein
MTQKIFLKNSKGLKICGILEEPNINKKEIIILVHGHGSHKDGKSIKIIADEFNKRKMNSFRIDINGCGESEGKFEDQTISNSIDDISSAIELMKQKGYLIINLMGSSCGGLMVMATALKHPEINRIGLKAPVSDYPSQWLWKYGQEEISKWKKDGYMNYVNNKGKIFKQKYIFCKDNEKYVMHLKAQNIKCPILIIHGTEDKSVLIEDSRKLIKIFPNGKLIELKGADHEIEINGDRSLGTKLFADWFEKGEANL